MNEERKNMSQKKWLAAVMGMVMPGMGQIYNGELIKGISSLIIFLALFAAGLRWAVLLPDGMLIVGAFMTFIAALAVYIIAVIDAYRKAKSRSAGHQTTKYNRWYFYLAVWLLGSVLVSGSVYDYVKNNVIEAYKIATRSMEPIVLKGDRVFADKTAYRRMAPKKGDIVLFVYPDDRSKVFIKRIEGLPGDRISLRNGTIEEVPHGMVYVLGDNKDQSVDSRTFGFVPLRDVLGKARQVCYSSGDEGIRWRRIGATLNRSAD
jgi:signal peptidase I